MASLNADAIALAKPVVIIGLASVMVCFGYGLDKHAANINYSFEFVKSFSGTTKHF